MEKNPRGFLTIQRVDPGYRPVEERLRDYRAVERQLSHAEIRDQAARCMDCGTPFCHAHGCPLGNIVPEMNDAVFHGQWEQALKLLLSTNPFPEFTGRVCPAPCEASCVAGIDGDPVTIRQIEQTIVEMGFERGDIVPDTPADRRPERVAVVGSGPAGLAAADLLNRCGYRVTVYDSADRPGGILRYGIPDFKLEKWVVERRIDLMKEEGIAFEMNVAAGEDVSHRYLQSRFDALCLACGAREPRDLAVPGRDLSGIHPAMDYLVQQNRLIAGEPVDPAHEIQARGKRVVVIGGGDTGSDCVGTALRQGAERVDQWEILPQPPDKRDPSTPWPLWPLKRRTTHAHEEGGRVRWSVMTRAFLGEQGRLKGIRAGEVDWVPKGPEGPVVPQERPGTEFEVQADLVLLAMGFVGPRKGGLLVTLDLERDERGNVRIHGENATSKPGVFAAGDMTLGPSLVVRALADGRKAARGIMEYLSEAR